ncbi:MAG: hypothetical protein M3680_32230 [Myxococcota bacterium]|nr:hypothetical protein [Myxococcota bacterium]
MTRTFALATAAILGSFGGIAAADVNQTIEIIDRPRTLPARTLELSLQLGIVRTPGGPMGEASTGTGVALGIGYGFTPDFEARLLYGFSIDPSSAKGPLLIGGAYSLVHVGAFQAAADLFVGYNFGSENALPLAIGVEAQLKLGSKLALFTPGHQLSFGLEDPNAILLDLPIGLGYQASRNLFLDIQTTIARIALSEGETSVWGADFIPITLEAFYSVTNAVDFGVTFSDDLDNAGDTYALGLLVRLFL